MSSLLGNRLIPCLGCCKKCCREHGRSADISSTNWFHFLCVLNSGMTSACAVFAFNFFFFRNLKILYKYFLSVSSIDCSLCRSILSWCNSFCPLFFALGIFLKEFSEQCHKSFPVCFLLIVFTSLCLAFKSSIHLELTSVFNVRRKSDLILLYMNT